MQKLMQRLLSAVPLFLVSSWAFAAMKEMEQAPSAPAETVDMVYVVIFIVLFIGMIVGFFVYMWWLDKNKKKEQ
jgi:heme/copper-type cytochrome/quinol oxidase subunit 2